MATTSLDIEKRSRQPAGRLFGIGTILRLLGLCLSVAIGIYVLRQLDLNHLYSMISGLSIAGLLVVFAIYMLLNFFRALRFRVLLKQQAVSLRLLYPIALYHNFLVRTLPFKTGELSYVVMLRHYLGGSIHKGVASLVSARLFDLLVVTSGCIVGLLTSNDPQLESVHLIFALFVPCLVICGIMLYFAGPLLRRVLSLGARLPGVGDIRVVSVIQDKLYALAGQFDQIRDLRFFMTTLLLSVCNYGASAAFNLILLWMLGIRANPGTLIVVVSLAMFAEAMPFSIAGLGLVEGGWTLGLTQFAGLPTSQAASIGVFLHACQLISVVISGLIGYCALQIMARPALLENSGSDGQPQ